LEVAAGGSFGIAFFGPCDDTAYSFDTYGNFQDMMDAFIADAELNIGGTITQDGNSFTWIFTVSETPLDCNSLPTVTICTLSDATGAITDELQCCV
jgi:hypothetical protein